MSVVLRVLFVTLVIFNLSESFAEEPKSEDSSGNVVVQDQQTDTKGDTSAAPAATNPSEIQTLRLRLETLQRASEEVATRSQQRLDDLNAKLAAIANPVGTTSQQVATLRDLLSDTIRRLNDVEKNALDAANNSIEIDKVRYLAGEKIQKVILHNAATLRVSTALGASLSQFQTALNPAADENFRKELEKLKQKVSKGTGSFLEKVQTSGWLSSPIVSLAVSFGTFLAGDIAQDKLDQYSNVICLSQFVSQNVADIQVVDQQIRILDSRVDEFYKKGIERFRDYANVIKFSGGYKEVLTTIQNTSQDPLRLQADVFFASLPKRRSSIEALSSDYVALRFQIDKVKEYIAEYELLLKDVNAFFGMFHQIVLNAVKSGSDCAEKQSIRNARETLNNLASNIANAQSSFETAYIGSVSAESKRVLYGGQ